MARLVRPEVIGETHLPQAARVQVSRPAMMPDQLATVGLSGKLTPIGAEENQLSTTPQ
jgi:hypothetical protein